MERDAQSKRKLYQKIFLKSSGGKNSNTILFDQISFEKIKSIKEYWKIPPDEIPIIISIVDDKNGIVISSKRIVCQTDGVIYGIEEKNILSVTDAFDLQSSSHLNEVKSNFGFIFITTSSGETHKIKVESGFPHTGILRVIERIIFDNK